MNKNNFDSYHHYQKSISTLGKIYRNYYLYPRLNFYISSNDVVLDYGAGLGDFLLSRDKNQSYGIEINPFNVEYCKNLGLNVSLSVPNQKNSHENNFFDSIVMDNVLEHIPDPDHDLKEIHRMLKIGGSVVIGVPGEKGYASDPDHKVYYDKNTLIELMNRYGFKYEHGFYAPLPFLFLSKKISQFCFYGFFKKL